MVWSKSADRLPFPTSMCCSAIRWGFLRPPCLRCFPFNPMLPLSPYRIVLFLAMYHSAHNVVIACRRAEVGCSAGSGNCPCGRVLHGVAARVDSMVSALFGRVTFT